jgi:hypothetical protein
MAAIAGAAMSEQAYLFCRVGPYGLLFPAAQVAHVWAADDDGRTDDDRTDDGGAATDLRRLFGLDATRAGPRVSLNAPGGTTGIAVVDHVASLHVLADAAFQPLPSALQYARAMFDAVCAEPIEGVYGLRLRSDPRFVEIAGWAPVRQREQPSSSNTPSSPGRAR